MSVRNLKQLFAPRSVALVGATDRPGSVGATLLRNLRDCALTGRFDGQLFPVNPHHESLAGLPVWPEVAALPQAPDLAIVCTPPATVPGIVRALGALGTRAAIVMSSIQEADGVLGRNDGNDRNDRNERNECRGLRQAMLDAAHPYLLRILGPDSGGILVPGIGLNASIALGGAAGGRIAFVSDSGAMMTGVLDWARMRGIGFSSFVALGDAADVDVGDVLDYLASDPGTGAILLHVQDLRYARKFMSAARAAARSKPTLVLKAGRSLEGLSAGACLSGVLARPSDVVDAAIRRAGMLRVATTDDLFAGVETLARARPLVLADGGGRLAILGNGEGPLVLAQDALVAGGGAPAELHETTVRRLRELVPEWRGSGPLNLRGDAPPERYREAMEVLLHDPQADAVLVIHAPNSMVDPAEVARAVVPPAQATSRNVLACWLGGQSIGAPRAITSAAGLPSYRTPEDAVGGFLQIAGYRRNQQLLMEVPASVGDGEPDRERARALVARALSQGRYLLPDPDTKAILACYGIPVVPTRAAATPELAVRAAQEIGFPVAVKILSPDVGLKTDVGGVTLDLDNAEGVRAAAERMARRLGDLMPQARLEGFIVQAMARQPEAHELIAGAATDLVFGPVILFGQGGLATEVAADHAVALPPLNTVLAHDLIRRTRVARQLAGYRHHPPADLDAVAAVLVQVSRLIADVPEIVELDINPLLADSRGAIVLDARMRVAMADRSGSTLDRLAIRPYPAELEESVQWEGAPLVLRPIRPEDGPAHIAMFNALTPDDIRYRMFVRMRELLPAQLARFTQIDYDREMAFIATRPKPDGQPETLGVARVVTDPDNVSAEFAVTVRSDLKGKGLGMMLMRKLIDYCRARGTREIVGEALPQNAPVVKLVRKLGFTVGPVDEEEGVRKLRLELR